MSKALLPLNKRQQQAMETRLHVYYTALEIFRERDYDSVKVPELCKAAGVSIGTFYNYFQSKEELIMTAYKNSKISKDRIPMFSAEQRTRVLPRLRAISIR